MAAKTMTAPLALVYSNNKVVSLLKNFSWTETLQRQDVRELGNLMTVEVPAVSYSGTFSADSSMPFSLESPLFDGQVNRIAQNNLQYQDTVTLLNPSFVITILKKEVANIIITANGQELVTGTQNLIFAVITRAFWDSENFSIAEASVGSRNISGRFLDPILYVQ